MSRRPSSFNAFNYGPCPCCLEWMNTQFILRHLKSCPKQKQKQQNLSNEQILTNEQSNNEENTSVSKIDIEMTKKELQTMSDVIAGREEVEKVCNLFFT